MPDLTRPDGTSIHYEVLGREPRLLALAPGIVNSEIDAWRGDSLLEQLRESHGVVVMDQRYSGRSTGPNYPFSYAEMTGDQLAVADDARMGRFVVLGKGIGANYALRLACLAPERVVGAVAIGPLGRPKHFERSAYYGLFAETCRVARAEGLQSVVTAALHHPRFDESPGGGPYAARLANDDAFVEETVRKGRERYVTRVVRFRDGMFPDHTPFFSVTPGELADCEVPLAVVPGDSELAPERAAVEIAEAARNATLIRDATDSVLGFVASMMQSQ